MTEEVSVATYCEVCGIDVDAATKLKRFGKLFCTEDHMNQYVKARQRRLGLEDGISEKGREEREEPRRRSGWSC